MKNILAILVFLGCSFTVSYAQKSAPLSEEVKKSIQFRIDNDINVGIVVGIIGPEGTQYYAYGVKSKKTGEPVDEHSIFEIGSISKTFTGILLADKDLKGEMKLDDPLQKYLPAGVTAPTRGGENIKLVHMSNHTSSLPRMPNNFTPANPANPYVDYSEKQLYDFLSSYELTRDIGSQYEYSNYAVGLLGHTMAAQSKMTYEALMKKVITKPLKMKNTGIALTPKMKKNLAIGHSNGIEVENWDFTTLAGAGAIRSSTVDMIKYISANMGIKKSKLYPAMQLSHKNTRKEGFAPIVGLGWHVDRSNDQEVVWHNGGTGGYRTFAGFIKGGNKGVVVMTNSTTGVDDIGRHILNPSNPLREIKPSIANKLRDIIDTKGIEAGVKAYWQLKEEKADEFDFAEGELNNLGYYYIGKEELEKAIAVLKTNVKAFPKAFNTYDSLGEAYKIKGDKEKAITNYKKSIELNPGNEGGINMLKELGVDAKDLIKEVVVDEKTMESYVGNYELVPGFIVTITKDGKQLEAQATGQPKFPIFPKSDNVFYFKVVEAQLTFNSDEDGEIKSVTLLQGGQEVEGKKID